jgi:hypothetical protein
MPVDSLSFPDTQTSGNKGRGADGTGVCQVETRAGHDKTA